MRRLSLTLTLTMLAAVPVACGSDDDESDSQIGAPCVPSEENQIRFSGYGDGNSFEVESLACEGNFCLSYSFIGRVSCPYGQTQEEIDTLDGNDPARCRAPSTGEPITVPVQAQSVDRPPELAVFCTCRCEGPQPEAEYCTCPTGTECRHLVDDVGLEGSADFAGSYCVRSDYDPDEDEPPGPYCEKDSTDPETDCGNNRENP